MPEQFSKETLLVLHPADSAIQHSLQLLAERDELIGVAKAFESSRAIVASIDRASVQRLFSLARTGASLALSALRNGSAKSPVVLRVARSFSS